MYNQILGALVLLIKAFRLLIGTDKFAQAILFSFVSTNPIKFWKRGTKSMQMTDLQSVTATIMVVDAEGNPAVGLNLLRVPTTSVPNPATQIEPL